MNNALKLTLADYIKSIYEKRFQKNAKYSLRAFARDLGIESANLSRVLKGQRGFSNTTIKKISSRLSLNQTETELLQFLSEKEFNKSLKIKNLAAKKIKQHLLYQSKIQKEHATLISEWYHLAILALLDFNTYTSDTDWIAQQIGIDPIQAEQAIERLITVGAVKKNGNEFVSTGNLFIDPKSIPTTAVRKLHKQLINKAIDSIESQSADNRDLSSILFSFDKENLPAAKEKIKKFREDFEAEFGPNSQSKKQSVYAMTIQLFEVTENSLQKESHQ